MQAEFEKVLAVLQNYISPVNARSMLLRALKEQRLSPETLNREDLRKCGPALRRGVTLFVEPARREAALSDLSTLCGADPSEIGPTEVHILAEVDIGKARAEARRVCDAAGASAFVMQKVATIVSELARNMVLYAHGGTVEITMASNGRRIAVRASDRGRGIPNLDEIMSGRYKSKTGMGRGLLGTKRLADRFEISTGSLGTQVLAEVAV